jgi:hypothetical protein
MRESAARNSLAPHCHPLPKRQKRVGDHLSALRRNPHAPEESGRDLTHQATSKRIATHIAAHAVEVSVSTCKKLVEFAES